MGRRPTPVELKVARGTDRKDRDGDPASRPKGATIPVVPAAPESLGEIGRERWAETCQRLITMGVLEDRYLHAVEAYCLAYEALAAANAVIEEEGMYYPIGTNGAVAKHPAASEAKQARDEIRRYQIEFGFTPSSASSVKSKTAATKAGPPTRDRRA